MRKVLIGCLILVFSEMLFLLFQGRFFLAVNTWCVFGVKSGMLDEAAAFQCFDTASRWVYARHSDEVRALLEEWRGDLPAPLPYLDEAGSILHEEVDQIRLFSWLYSEEVYLSKLYYETSLKAFRSGYDEEGKAYLARSIILSPQLSYYWLELAHIYMQEDSFTEAEGLLELCGEFYFPVDDCMAELSYIRSGGHFRLNGHLRDAVNAYYKEKE